MRSGQHAYLETISGEGCGRNEHLAGLFEMRRNVTCPYVFVCHLVQAMNDRMKELAAKVGLPPGMGGQ